MHSVIWDQLKRFDATDAAIAKLPAEHVALYMACYFEASKERHGKKFAREKTREKTKRIKKLLGG